MRLLSTGLYLPPSTSNADVVAVSGTPGNMWAKRTVALPDDHPATMAATALSRALASSGVAVEELALVVYCGRARDYLPGWSVATEVMRTVGTARACAGIDLAMGCATLPAALELARGWLTVPGRKFAAIVDAERWSDSIDRTDPESQRLWAYGDGAAALVLAAPSEDRVSVGEYLGAAFASHPGYNSFLIPPYGGTRRPHAETPAHQLRLALDGTSAVDVFGTYGQLYESTLADLAARSEFSPPQHIVCSQLSPAWVSRIVPRFHKPRPESVVSTGDETGHVGGVDLLIGLDALLRRGDARGHVLLAGTAPFVTAQALVRLTST